MKLEQNKYDANFTAGGLLFSEFIALEGILLNEQYKGLLTTEIEENKWIAIETHSARKRVVHEILRRRETVPRDFWASFYTWSENEQRLALLFVCLKTYKLLLDIHWEVTIKKFRTGLALDALSISMFLDELSSKDDQVASWSTSTTRKINVQYRKALKDAGLLKNESLHMPIGISESFWDYFRNVDEYWWLEACFIA